MQEYSTTDITNICKDVAKQRSLFLCVFSSCQARHYGPALASAILACSDRGANISPLLPVEIRSEKIAHRQLSPDPGFSDPLPTPDNIQESVAGHKLTLALECNAGQDGVVTVSLSSSPPTFATHIPQAPGFPDGRIGPSATDASSTSAGPTMTQLQGRPPLPSEGGGPLTVSNSNQGGQTGQRGQAGSDSVSRMDTDYETTSTPSAKESGSRDSKNCGCGEETKSTPTKSVSACQATAQQVSKPTTGSSTTSSSCEESSEAAVASAAQESSSSTSSASSTSSVSSTTRTSSISAASSVPEESSCETLESVTKHTPKASATSTSCSEEETTSSGNMHIPKLPAQKLFSNATSVQPMTSTISTTSATETDWSSSCDTTSSSSVRDSSATTATSSVTSTATSSSASSATSANTSAASTSSLQPTKGPKEAERACSTPLSSKSTRTPSSLASKSTVSQKGATSHASEPPAYTKEDLPQAYDKFTPIPLPSYTDAAPPEYGASASAQGKSAVSRSSSQSSASFTSSASTPTSLSAFSSSTTTEMIPSYGYNFPAASETTKPASTTSTAESRSPQATSKEEHPDGTSSFLSSDPGHEVENTASSESKSNIPGIETVPLPIKSSTTQAPVTTQVLPIGGGPPVLFVTIIEPDADGNLETSVLTVSEQSPWQTPMASARPETDNTLHARVDGYRMGMTPNVLTQDIDAPASTMSPASPSNRTTTLEDATRNATESSANVMETNTPSSIPVVSSASTKDYYLSSLVFLLGGATMWLVSL